MTYCMHCGEKLTKHNETYYECQTCGHKHYRNPVATVGIAIHDGHGGIICSRRKFEPFKGRLDCIGGFVDFGENNEQALERELKEEIGVNLDQLGPIGYLTSVHAHYPWMGKDVSLVCAMFIADLHEGTILTPGDDVESLEVFDLNQSFTVGDFEDEWMYVLLSNAKKKLKLT